MVVTSSVDAMVKLWDIRNIKVRQALNTRHRYYISSGTGTQGTGTP